MIVIVKNYNKLYIKLTYDINKTASKLWMEVYQ